MSRSSLALVAVIAALVGALAMFYFNPANTMLASTSGAANTSLAVNASPALNENDVRQIVEQMMAERDAETESATPVAVASAVISQEELNPLIENYLMADPKILQRVSNALQEQLRVEEIEAAQIGLATYETEIYAEPGDEVLGNPDGDVTLVEFFDYNCVFCRRAMPDVVQLMAEDKNLRVILKEFPILSENSVDAARIGVAVANTEGADYWTFHEELYTVRGQIGKEAALTAAENIGLSRVSVELDSQSQEVTDTLQRTYALAQGLDITGTPAFIIGDQIIPGAVGVDALREAIANVRECGSTNCGNLVQAER